jgi:hypothetical protein
VKRPSRETDSQKCGRSSSHGSTPSSGSGRGAIAEGLVDGAADQDPAVLDGVVRVHPEIAGCLDVEIDQGMPRQLRQHVVEESDPGPDPPDTGPVEIDGDPDGGLSGRTLGACLAGHGSSSSSAWMNRSASEPMRAVARNHPVIGPEG